MNGDLRYWISLSILAVFIEVVYNFASGWWAVFATVFGISIWSLVVFSKR